MSEAKSIEVEARIAAMERKVEELNNRVDVSIKNVEDKIAELISKVESRVDAIDIRMEKISEDLDSRIKDIDSKSEINTVRLENFEMQWPILNSRDDGNDADGDFEIVRSRRFRRQEKNMSAALDATGTSSSCVGNKKTWGSIIQQTENSVMVIGDSLARGVGHKLKQQCGTNVVTVESMSGAKIADVKRKISGLAKDEKRELVVLAGANNILKDSSVTMLRDYENLLDTCKEKTETVLVVGLVKRYGVDVKYERMRMDLNVRLRKMCTEKGIKFVEYEPRRDRVHSDGLHLNTRGQNELGQKLFQLCKNFLA